MIQAPDVKTSAGREVRPLGAARAELLAWAAIGIVNVVATNVVLWPPASVSLRMVRGAFDMGHAIALGLASWLAVLTWSRAKRVWGARLSGRAALASDLAAVTVAAFAPALPVLGPDLSDLAAGVGEDRDLSPALVQAVMAVVVASGIPTAAAVGRLLARPALRWIAILAAIGLAVGNHALLTADYPGAHLYMAWAAAVLGGAAIATLPVAVSARPLARRVALACAALMGVWSVLVRPRDVVLTAMLEEVGTTLAPFLVRMRAPSRYAPADIPPELSPWFVDRSNAPAIPPTSQGAPPDQIVILYTIDSLRADVITSGEHDRELPELAGMKREGVHFTQARPTIHPASPGSWRRAGCAPWRS